MLGTYFYNETIRKTVTAFGTLFNNIEIRHKDNNNNTFSIIKVPLNYGPIQKYLARIEQQPELPSQIALTLPRMSFEMTSFQYDPSRKASVIQTFKTSAGPNVAKKTYLPVPYNIGFQLNIAAKLQDDVLQVIEQILPYFQPAFNVTIKVLEDVGETRDIPFVLDNITFSDDYEGDFSQRRFIVYTLSFTAKTYMFGPVSSDATPLIENIQLTYYGTTNKTSLVTGSKTNIISSSVEDITYKLNENVKIGEKLFTLNTTEYLQTGDCLRINDEIVKITCVESTTEIKVDRAQNNTVESEHLINDNIFIVDCRSGQSIDYTKRFNTTETTTFLDDFNVC
jgi:hypothetical protein